MLFMIANWLLALLPPTRFFGLKRSLLRPLGITVGEGSNICGDVRFYGGGRIRIGSGCWIGLGTKFYTSPGYEVVIGDRCDIAPDVCFMAGSHELGDHSRRAGAGTAGEIRIGDGCWIGVRSTILGGCHLMEGSMVGAGSLLLAKPYKGATLWAGSPAKPIRELSANGLDHG